MVTLPSQYMQLRVRVNDLSRILTISRLIIGIVNFYTLDYSMISCLSIVAEVIFVDSNTKSLLFLRWYKELSFRESWKAVLLRTPAIYAG